MTRLDVVRQRALTLRLLRSCDIAPARPGPAGLSYAPPAKLALDPFDEGYVDFDDELTCPERVPWGALQEPSVELAEVVELDAEPPTLVGLPPPPPPGPRVDAHGNTWTRRRDGRYYLDL